MIFKFYSRRDKNQETIGRVITTSRLQAAKIFAEREGVSIEYEPIPDPHSFRTYTCADLDKLKQTLGRRDFLTVYNWLDTQYK